MRGWTTFRWWHKFRAYVLSSLKKRKKAKKKFQKNWNVLLVIRENKGSGDGIFVIIGKMTLKKRVRKQKENKLRNFLWSLKLQKV